MKKYAIYSVLVGKNYDKILQPLVIDERFDYILFTNDFGATSLGVWKIRPIAYDNQDTILVSRYPKINSHIVLYEYEATLYHDANLQIADSYVYDRFIELAEKRISWAGINHPRRDCIYQEAFALFLLKLEHLRNGFSICHFLIKNGYPLHYGLNENNIIFRSRSEETQKVETMWWQMVCEYSHRDQLSLMCCFWKLGVGRYLFLKNGEHPQNTSLFNYAFHKENSKKVIKMTLLERILYSRLSHSDKKNRLFIRFYNLCTLPFPSLTLLFWSLLGGIREAPKITLRYIRRISKSSDLTTYPTNLVEERQWL